MFSFIGWVLKTIIKLAIAGVLFLVASFYLHRDNFATARFDDGSQFTITTNDQWFAVEDTLFEYTARLIAPRLYPAEFIKAIASQSFVVHGPNSMLSSLLPIDTEKAEGFFIAANNFGTGTVCTNPVSGGKIGTDIYMPSAKANAFYCDMPDEHAASGTNTDIFFPVAADKFAVAVVDKQFWQNHSAEILAILKTATYQPVQ